MSAREPGRPPFLQGPPRIPTSHDADHARVLIALACLMELLVTAAKARKQTAKALERANRSVCIRPDGHLLGAPLWHAYHARRRRGRRSPRRAQMRSLERPVDAGLRRIVRRLT